MSIIQGTAKSGGSASFYDFLIGDSLRFDGSSYLSRTFGSGDSTTTWTFSSWVKRSKLGTATTDRQVIIACGPDEQNNDTLYFYQDDIYSYFKQSDSGLGGERPTALLRDTSSWYNIILAINLNESANADKIKTYINGVLQTSFSTDFINASFASTLLNSNILHRIGARTMANDYYFNGYLANIQFIDGQALDQYFFGEFKDNIWVPYNAFSTAGSGTATASDGDTATDSYGTNGFRLAFDSADFNWSGSSTMTDPYGSATAVPIYGVADASGNGKHWVMNS